MPSGSMRRFIIHKIERIVVTLMHPSKHTLKILLIIVQVQIRLANFFVVEFM